MASARPDPTRREPVGTSRIRVRAGICPCAWTAVVPVLVRGGSGIRDVHRSKNTVMCPGPSRSQAWSATSRGPFQGEPGGEGVLVGAQPGNERLQRGLAGGDSGCHPLLQVASAPVGHDPGEGPDMHGDRGQFRRAGEDGVQAGRSSGSRPPGLVMIQLVTARGLGGAGGRSGMLRVPRCPARWRRTDQGLPA